jgi:MFS family permease
MHWLERARRRLPLLVTGHGFMRIGGGAGSVLVGLYLSDLANRGHNINAALVGTLGAVSFAAELVGAIPMGILADIVAPRLLMIGGGVLGAAAIYVMGLTSVIPLFFLSRALEGFGAAASVPSILAYLTDVTEGARKLRGRVMSYFELTLLAGIALGGPFGGRLWVLFRQNAFTGAASVYLISAVLLAFGAISFKQHSAVNPVQSLRRALGESSVRRLAPAWVCMNAIVGLWLGPTFVFLLTRRDLNGQYLTGRFADDPETVGWILLGYSIVFATGITTWSFVLHRISRKKVLYISLVAMLVVCISLYAFNHSQSWPAGARWALLSAIALSVMVESGFTPAALALLADVVGGQTGRGSAMGIYSALLGIGALGGSIVAGILGARFAVDGLIYGTLVLAVLAMTTIRRLPMIHRGIVSG